MLLRKINHKYISNLRNFRSINRMFGSLDKVPLNPLKDYEFNNLVEMNIKSCELNANNVAFGTRVQGQPIFEVKLYFNIIFPV